MTGGRRFVPAATDLAVADRPKSECDEFATVIQTEGSAAGPAVAIENVSKTFPGQRALDAVSMSMRRGEIHGLLGENGSGKSTLIKILSGYYTPDPGGRVEIGGEPLTFASATDSTRLGLRFVHQHLGVIDQLTAIENVALSSGYAVGLGRRINLKAQARRTQEVLDRLGVDVDLWRPLGECRAIDRTVVAIARALDGLDNDRGVLVLDEPTAALPPDEVEHLFEVVRELRRRGVTTIYVSHRLDEVFDLCDRVSILRDGVMQGTFDIAALDRRSLIRLIVGQDIDEEAPPASAGGSEDASGAGSVGRTRPPRLAVQELEGGNLRQVSFAVQPGEFLGVAGLLGSGREELAYAVVGAVPSRARSRALDGVELGRLSPVSARRAGIGLIPGNRQKGSAISEFDVRENITLANLEQVRRGGRISRREELRTARRWIRELDLRPPDPAKSFGLLSGGNQQKAILARWFNTEPSVILVDEPTAGVDIGARHAIYTRMREHAATGVAFVVSSSDFDDLVELCSRVIVLRSGRVVDELQGSDITLDALLTATMGEADE